MGAVRFGAVTSRALLATPADTRREASIRDLNNEAVAGRYVLDGADHAATLVYDGVTAVKRGLGVERRQRSLATSEVGPPLAVAILDCVHGAVLKAFEPLTDARDVCGRTFGAACH